MMLACGKASLSSGNTENFSGTTAVTHCIFTSGLQGDIIRHSLSAPVLSTVYCKSDRNSSMSREAEE